MGLVFEYLLLDFGALLLLLLLVAYLYSKRAFLYWKKKNVAFIEPSFPFGNFKDGMLFRKPFHEILEMQYKMLEGEDFGGNFQLTQHGLIFRDPDLIKTILVKDFPYFHDHGIPVNPDVEPLLGHLFMLSGTKWRNLRVKLSPTFTSGKMKMMFQTLVDCGIELQDFLGNISNEAQDVEIKDILARYSTDVIASCAFGIQCNSLKNPDCEFREWGKKAFKMTVPQMIIAFLSVVAPSVMDFFNLSMFDKEVSKYFRKMVKETVEYREKNNVKRNDFLQLLIQLKNKGYVAPDNESEESTTEAAEIN
ncbi:Cytochrome P450 6k1 [Blattella germanica]|nr:Cytochrome P450 6k1 [Blattella germanica]